MCLHTVRDNTGFAAPAFTALAVLASLLVAPVVATAGSAEIVVPNDNTRPAGTVDGNAVTIHLRAAQGRWQPEGPGGPALTVEAFGEAGSALSVPAPLIRIVEGATVTVSLDNDLDTPLRVHGLCARDGQHCAPLDVPPRERREVRFTSGRSGTYHYWATSMGAPMPFRELAGALVVDPPGGSDPDRIFVITEWASLTPAQLRDLLAADDVDERFVALAPRITFVINGLSWPATERLAYQRGETVRWRVINLSSQLHPMHLHGFYFTVRRTGDGFRDAPAGDGDGLRVVTHPLPSGGTLVLEWTPEREGNWLFHCHIMHHVSPARRLDADPHAPAADAGHGSHHGSATHDAGLGMAGMVLGITVRASRDVSEPARPPGVPARRLTMTIGRGDPSQPGGISVAFAETSPHAVPAAVRAQSPGPVLVLRRGEPVEITILNELVEPTSIHWHGLELESYYDGVHGWSGEAGRAAPMVAPGGSFVVRLTPPRAGTFIYHTHLHDYRQLSSGLYGALIVTGKDDMHDPAVDHVIVLGRRGASEASAILQDASSLVVNGERAPRWHWKAGTRHRIRVVNITPDDLLSVVLREGDAPAAWRLVAKDGMTVPIADGPEAPAQARVAVGETYDFEYDAPLGRGTLWLDVRSTSGKWQAQAQVLVR